MSVIFEVQTDASEYAIAATLNQGGRPVAFFSCILQGSELRHHSVEKEAQGKINNDKIMRWRVELSCYSFDIIYRPGKTTYHLTRFHAQSVLRLRSTLCLIYINHCVTQGLPGCLILCVVVTFPSQLKR